MRSGEEADGQTHLKGEVSPSAGSEEKKKAIAAATKKVQIVFLEPTGNTVHASPSTKSCSAHLNDALSRVAISDLST